MTDEPETPEAHDAAAEPAPGPEARDDSEPRGAPASGRRVDEAIIDAISRMQRATIDSDAVLAGGQGKAFQLVALSAALAVQDATDMLRNNTMIASTASGVALGGLIATGDPRFETAIAAARKMMIDAIADFEAIGVAAARLIACFPVAERTAQAEAD